MTVQDVSDARLSYADFLRNLPMRQSNVAEPKDLTEYLRRNSSALPTPKIFTVGDWLKMCRPYAGRGST